MPEPLPAPTAEELSGEIAAVIFANPSSGFAVVEVVGDDLTDSGRASGPLAGLVPGQPVRLLGRWTTHERYGPTFAAVAYEHDRPRSEDGLAAFLASERFPGVGEVLASRLVETFGLDLGDVIASDPQRLAGVKGITPALATSIAQAWDEAGALADVVRLLAEAGIPAATAAAVHRHFGESARHVVQSDPYALRVVRGVGWGQLEALGRRAGIPRDDLRRLVAGTEVAHRQHAARHGHVALPEDVLLAEAARLLGVGEDQARLGLRRAEEAGLLRRDDLPQEATGPPLWYHPADLAAERGLAAAVARLRTARSTLRGAARRYEPSPELTAEQVAAVRAALEHPVSVLTGGPGTGKTRTVLELVRVAEEEGISVGLCAPTGRAARRLEEVTGHGASTVHRLLEARPASSEVDGDGRGGFVFGYDDDRRLPFELVIADEWSMADVRLAWSLARAVSDGSHLVLVGDVDQLPSVGAGAVLRDLLSEPVSGGDEPLVAATRLRTVHRQAAASRIVTLAHEVNAGAVAQLRGRDNDVFVVPETAAGIVERVAEIVAVRAPAFYGIEPSQVQVLAPMYRGPCGVDALNAGLKERLNPAGGRTALRGFHEGDRVVATRNDAELDVANGDIGEVVETDVRERTLTVAFGHGIVTYPSDRIEDLQPAWCLTVHKSQGGEWPVVVLVLDRSHRPMLWRELVYTAITRAERGLLLVGDASLVGAAAGRTGSGARLRRTRLADRIAAAAVQQRLDVGGGNAVAAGKGADGDPQRSPGTPSTQEVRSP
jgi:exodeoxyribonuclease V alpha subunit